MATNERIKPYRPILHRAGVDPYQGLEFGKGHFDGIEIGAVCGQKEKPSANVAHGLRGRLAFVR